MLTYSQTQKRRITAFILGLALAVSTCLPLFRALHSPGAFLYMGLVLAWALTVRRRILHWRIRHLLLCCCAFMIFSFVLRVSRYDLFRELRPVTEYCLYLYGVCYTMAALLSFLTALQVGRGEGDEPRRLLPLWLAAGLLSAAMLTNPWHHWFYTFAPGGEDIARHGPVYFLMTAWCAVFAVAAIALLFRRCRNSASRRWWFLPVGAFAAGAGLLTWYFLAGGAPKAGNLKLFNLHEAFCLTVILPFEAMFRIGLIPTNSDYALFFRRSVIKAALLDESGETAVVSPSYSADPGAGERLRHASIPGGSVVWFEDIGELLRLREELTALNEELDAENELIREENRLREERIAFETRNRLYDGISRVMEPQIEAMQTLMAAGEGADFPARLERVLVMGAYMKRMGNLMLLGDGKRTLSTLELALSLGESLEYLRLAGVACALEAGPEEELPTARLISCYQVFEHFIEACWGTYHACRLALTPDPGTLLRMELDCPALRGGEDRILRETLAAQDLRLETAWEDDTWCLSLCRTGGDGREAGV
ncbi:MAG: hypothetical protein IKN89_05460 [Oscillospiraceae bacterium]|nr:hypothetical protein [Oscillospiraceae bacterium]